MSFTVPAPDDVLALLKELRERDIKVFLDADTIRVRAPKAGVSAEIKERLRACKTELIAFLRSAGNDELAALRIPARPAGVPVPLSFLQRKLWLIDQIEGGSIHYNMSMSLRIEGELDVESLRRTFEIVVQRHESLRTVFHADAQGNPQQVVRDPAPFALPVTDLSALAPAQVPAQSDQLRRAEENHPFDLARDPMLRASLVRLAPGVHLLFATMHHIASDGWSMDVFVSELSRIYAACVLGHAHGLAPLPIQYGDYAAWMQDWLQGEVLARQVDYWTGQLADLPVLHRLPLDRPRPKTQTMHGARLARRYPPRLTDQLETLARAQETTLFMLMQSLFALFLARWSGAADVVMGTPISSRFKPELSGLIGFFTNTLVLRSRCDGLGSFADFLQASRTMLLDAQANQHMPFEMLIDILNPVRDLAYNPLVQIVFTLQNNEAATVDRLRLPGVEIAQLPSNGNVNAKFDLELTVLESPDGLLAKWTYNTDLFDAATIERMDRYFGFLLECVTDQPHAPLATLPLPPAEQALIAAWNDSAVAFPAHSTICGMFEAQAARTPAAPALRSDDGELRYGELNRRANQLARVLVREHGIGAGARVAVALERAPEMLVGLLAIMKAGGAYVPLDPSHPRERLAHVLADSGAALVLVQPQGAPTFAPLPVALLDIADPARFAREDDSDLAGRCQADSLAYVIYTSGSTGRPKGTLNLQRGVCNRLHTMQHQFGLTPADRVLHKTPLTFDVSVWELFWPLTAGATLVLARPEGHKDPDYLAQAVRRHAVTVLHFVPSMLQVFVDSAPSGLGSLRYLMTSGEALGAELQAQCIAAFPGVGLHNHYGPTETAIEVSWWPFDVPRADRKVPIGRPVANTVLHILDRHDRPVPVGVVGELHIGGVQVGEGYLNQPELTAQKFVLREILGTPQRLYRSGDLARWLDDGNIEYIGRVDQQVKLRGMRVELGDIEAALLAHPQVRHAVVLLVADDPGVFQGLLAWIVPEENAPSSDEVRAWLRERVPEYMVPAHIVRLAALPVTANGKLDRKALPLPDFGGLAGAAATEPLDARDEALSLLWAEVLARPVRSSAANFFDLGGHSLLAIQLASKIRRRFDIEIPLKAVFSHPVLRDMAQWVARQGRGGAQAAIARRGDDAIALSDGQQRLWLLAALEGPSATYNIARRLALTGPLDVPALEQAFADIVARHDALRLALPARDGLPAPVLRAAWRPVVLTDLSSLAQPQQELEVQRLAQAHARRPFDLAVDPLLRVDLLVLGAQRHVLLVNLHHIVSDGWSVGVLVREFAALYGGRALPALPIQYPDYVAWHRDWLAHGVLEQQRAYWRTRLAGAPALLALPLDRARPAVASYRGRLWRAPLAPTLRAGLQRLAQAHGCTPFMVALAVFKLLLARYSGQDDICVGTPVANRAHFQAEDLIGFFANTLVLRSTVDGGATFADLLAQVRQTALDAYQHQDLPFERLVEDLNPPRSLSHSPLFQVMFRFESAALAQVELPGLQVRQHDSDGGGAKFDISLTVIDGADGLCCEWEYATDLFEPATLARLHRHYERLLHDAAADPALPLAQLAPVDGDELATLARFNDTAMPWPRAALLHDAFEAQAAAHPERTALGWRSEKLSYGDLNRRANQIAHRLLALGVRPDERVAVCTERTPGMVAALLGILKAGAAYVPLDPAYPAERLAYMLADCAPAAVLCEVATAARVPPGAAPQIVLDADPLLEGQPVHDPRPHGVQPSHLAYVIYTSGSTGQPKGVMIEHRNAVAFIAWAQAIFTLDQLELTLCATSINFDLAVYELFLPLSSGRPLALVQNVLCGDDELSEVTLINTVPSALDALLKAGRVPGSSRLVNLAGEPLKRHLVEQLFAETAVQTVGNLYGPSETTTYSTWVLMARADGFAPHIGRPIGNTQVHILDAHRMPVPVGVTGELYIGGAGVARGYLHRPELTAERFIADPFSPDPQARLYRTGDLGRWRADGNIEYLGRNDFQVKIRGFRIELGEIEAALAACDGVREAVALARGDGQGEPRLVAYAVAQPGSNLDAAQLRTALAAQLPAHMVPAALVLLDALPLTPNGKLDRAALPAPELATPGAGHEAPHAGLETTLAGIWQDLLGVERVGRHDNFFEIGGHSLLAVQVVAQLQRRAGIEVPVRVLFAQPVLAGLAAALEAMPREAQHQSLVAVRPGSAVPLFLIHPGEGEIGYAHQLAPWIDVTVPVYALAAVGFLEHEVPLDSVVAMAAHYRAAIQTVQPGGPYRLAGWSAGGMIACEIARQLREAGFEVSMLGLIDTAFDYSTLALGGAGDDGDHAHCAALLSWLPADLPHAVATRLDGMKALGDLTGMLACCQQAGLLAAGIDTALLRRHVGVRFAIMSALRRHVATVPALPFHLFSADGAGRADPTLGWGARAGSLLRHVPIGGSHYSIMERPHIETLGRALSAALRG